MSRFEPLVWVALSVIGLCALRVINRRGFNLYDPVVSEKERRRSNVRFFAFIFLYLTVALVSYFFKYFSWAL